MNKHYGCSHYIGAQLLPDAISVLMFSFWPLQVEFNFVFCCVVSNRIKRARESSWVFPFNVEWHTPKQQQHNGNNSNMNANNDDHVDDDDDNNKVFWINVFHWTEWRKKMECDFFSIQLVLLNS